MAVIPTPFFDELISSQETFINLTGIGTFTGGQIKISRVGNTVTFTPTAPITHASANTISVPAGTIPTWARPVSSLGTVFMNLNVLFRLTVGSDGSFAYAYFNDAFVAIASTGGNSGHISISYNV